MSVSRRTFLGGTAAAAIGAPIPTAACEHPKPTNRELVIWHMRELERLILDAGSDYATIFIMGGEGSWAENMTMGIRSDRTLIDHDGMFMPEGGAA